MSYLLDISNRLGIDPRAGNTRLLEDDLPLSHKMAFYKPNSNEQFWVGEIESHDTHVARRILYCTVELLISRDGQYCVRHLLNSRSKATEFIAQATENISNLQDSLLITFKKASSPLYAHEKDAVGYRLAATTYLSELDTSHGTLADWVASNSIRHHLIDVRLPIPSHKYNTVTDGFGISIWQDKYRESDLEQPQGIPIAHYSFNQLQEWFT
jgi:hypothetical protein